jgi:Ca-activated chloride channel family protein
VALVTFAGKGTLTCPLTVDHEAALLFLDTVDTDLIAVQGSSIAEALKVAARAFGPAGSEGRHRGVVLLSDGEDHEGGIEEAIRDLKQAGVSVYAIGCGTAHGGPIPVREASGVPGGYKKDAEGKVVTTHLDEDLLEKLAFETDGHYYPATPSEVEVEEIAKTIAGLDQKEFGTVLKTRYEERYQFPLGLALAALLAETVLGDRRRARREGEGTP